MVTGAPVWNVGSASPQKAASKTDLDHMGLGIMSVNSLEKEGGSLGNATDANVHAGGNGIILYLDIKSRWTALAGANYFRDLSPALYICLGC